MQAAVVTGSGMLAPAGVALRILAPGITALGIMAGAPAFAQLIPPTQQYESSLYKRAPSVPLDPHYGLPKAALPNMEAPRPTATPGSNAFGTNESEGRAPSADAPDTTTASGETPASRDQDFFADTNGIDLAKLRRPSAGILPSLTPPNQASSSLPSSFSSSTTISTSTSSATTLSDSWRSPVPAGTSSGDTSSSATSDTPLFTTSEGMSTGGGTTGDTTGAFTTR